MTTTLTGSVLSFPDRGPWGASRYRGNMTGHLYRHLTQLLGARSFCDPMAGSGSGPHAVAELGVQAWGLDLNPDFPTLAARAAQAGATLIGGFNILRDNLADHVGRVDLNLSHTPYGPMVLYSGDQWGAPHADDLSRATDLEDFLSKLQQGLMNQRDATRPGGTYGTIIGDLRKDGQYVSYQADLIARMPRELKSVLIKVQHGHTSSRTTYSRLRYPSIEHEYVLLFERGGESVYLMLADISNRLTTTLNTTWRAAIRQALTHLGGTATLQDLYAALGDHPRAQERTHWKAKVRQVVQLYPEFQHIDRGTYALTAA